MSRIRVRTVVCRCAALVLVPIGLTWSAGAAQGDVTDLLCTGSAAAICAPKALRPAPAAPESEPPYPAPAGIR